jgi:serine/threonine protein kinase
MEFCSKGSLFHVLSNPRYHIEWTKGFKFAIEMATGLNHLHTLKPVSVFHRDMKSLNVLITENWDIRLIDFGLARFSTGENVETMRNTVGTIGWTAVELLKNSLYGDTEIFTAKSDVYSMGVILWEIANRVVKGQYQRPYSEYPFTLDVQIIVQAAENDLRPTMPPCNAKFAALIERCWHRDPEKRPTCAEALAELHKLKEHFQQHPADWPVAHQLIHETKTISREASEPLGHNIVSHH